MLTSALFSNMLKMKSIFQKTKFLTLKVHEIKTTDQNLFKSSRNIKRYILIICKKFQGLSIFPNRNMNKKVCSKRCFPSTFVYSCFFEKIQFLQCLLSSVAPWLYDSMALRQTRNGKCLKFRSADCQKMHFSLIFLGNLEFIHTYKFSIYVPASV